jgi:Zn-dependent protease with chaperone function
MILSVAGLIVCTLVLGGSAGAFLDRSRWPASHPGTAIICWTGVLAGTLTSVSGTVILALLSPPTPAHGLLEWLDNCLPHHGHAGLAIASLVSIVLVVGCGLRLARGLPRLWRAVLHRRQHREMLRIVAKEDARNPDVLIIDHPIPVAYCLPARRRPIVVSTGAQARLDAIELAAVLAHERAHLRQRHHLMLALLDLTYTLLPWLPTIRRARVSLPPLLEMAADDVAARRCGPHALSAALVRLTILPHPAGALAAGGTPAPDRSRTLTRRLDRLETVGADSSGGARLLAWITAIGTVVGPVVTAALALTALPIQC